MIRESVDVLVVGSGFAGSLTALLLQRIGRRVALVDRRRHPRFAIGESATPLADLILRSLAERYDVPQLLPLCNYGNWKASYPQLVCGEKRGFSYFRHHPDAPFSSDENHSNELLVTASISTARADCHWLRSDVDTFFVRQAEAGDVLVLEDADLRPTSHDPWIWSGRVSGREIELGARFVIDASGPAGVVPRAVGAALETSGFLTRSHSVYGHFEELEPWQSVLERSEVDCSDHPFRADRAAVHHLLDEGWMWQLGFDNGVTSVGLVLKHSIAPDAAEAVWHRVVSRYPSLSEQFQCARLVGPGTRLVTTRRLQRRWKSLTGSNWVLLPASAAFVDPLHSTGIAHSLSGVERLVNLIDQCWGTPRLAAQLASYELELAREFEFLDHLVAACYASQHDFPRFVAATMLYYVAAITCEERRLAGAMSAFLATDDDELRNPLLRLARQLIVEREDARLGTSRLIDEIRTAIAPWNHAGLLCPDIQNMYRYTGR